MKRRMPSWSPPERPEWVKRVNEEGDCLDISGIVPLDESSLINTSIANTGLDDFGDDDWREPFRVLVKALEDEANLNLMGRILTRSDLLMFLEGRLRVEDTYRKHPEIEKQRVDRPLFIIGQGRSGTTWLRELLAQPPANRTITDGEAMFPVPLPGMSLEEQRDLAQRRITQWRRVTPELDAIHEFGVDTPTETIHLEVISFRTPVWLNLLGLTPSFNAYVESQKDNYEISLAYAKRVLKVLQWQRPGGQWVLGSNDAIRYMPAALKVFPDALFIWSHRDPVKAMASMVNMIGTMTWIRSDRRVKAAYEHITEPELTAETVTRPIDWIESGAIPRDQLYNVLYDELMYDPVAVVSSIYDYYGLPFTDETRQAIVDHVKAHPRTRRPAHRYALGADEQVREEREAFRRYQKYFNVPDEI